MLMTKTLYSFVTVVALRRSMCQSSQQPCWIREPESTHGIVPVSTWATVGSTKELVLTVANLSLKLVLLNPL